MAEEKKKRKTLFHVGDVVKLKLGSELNEAPPMKVMRIVWATNADGSLKKRKVLLENGKEVENNVLDGILCGWYATYTDSHGNTRQGEYLEKIFDSRDLVKVKRTAQYYLELAKDELYDDKISVELINKILERL
ncbi:MAG: hypothetical protein NZZ41_02240 [Candidatus Dojkabacteria bacterium]|nr:hypothetical protein [Candidatus Dojkabacteria bacterium]